MTDKDVATVRRAYAKQMLAVAGNIRDPALEVAFASVPRERYLGPPPWRIVPFAGHLIPLRETDPVLAYQDVLFALSPERGVNNGSPSLHARWLYAAAIRPGENVVHLGCGTGYYTALIAHLVGSSGHVTAVEYEGRLADLAKNNLAHLPNVDVIEGDGARWPQGETDCVYVNFSVERPAPAWMDHLAPGGRLLFPLGVPWPNSKASKGPRHSRGAALRLERRSVEMFAATYLGPAFFVCAEGGEGELVGTDAEREILRGAFERGGVDFVRSLRWRQPPSPTRSWFAGTDWSLCYDEAE